MRYYFLLVISNNLQMLKTERLMRCYNIIDKSLQINSSNIPIPKDNEVLIKVRAIGINRADIMQVNGQYKSPDNSNIPGLEFSGIRIDNQKKVCGLVSGGAYAEYITVKKDHLIELPESIDFIEAAALPEALVVTRRNLYELGNIKDKKVQRILIHGAASGIGSILTQFALLEEKEVYATAGDITKLQYLKSTKCHILSFHDKFDDFIRVNGKVDLIIDILGGKYLKQNINCCENNAKIISIAAMDNRFAEIDLGILLVKNLSIIGSTIRSKSENIKTRLIKASIKNLLPSIINKKVRPIMSKIFSFNEIELAHKYLKSGQNIGKIVITL